MNRYRRCVLPVGLSACCVITLTLVTTAVASDTRPNIILVLDSGGLVTPALELGAVEGLGLTIVIESRPEIDFVKLGLKDVASARELMSVNSVRGVVPIVELDGRPVADGHPGHWAHRLHNLFHAEPRNA